MKTTDKTTCRRALMAAAVLAPLAATPAAALDILEAKTIGTDLARDIADKTVQACNADGLSVSAVVVDRMGIIVALLRAEYAAPQTLTIAAGKARGAMMAGTSTKSLIDSRPDLAANLMHLDDVMMMEGGLVIEAGGSRIGAVGVSGAPGGDLDAACAQKALDELVDRIEFAQ